MSEVKIYLTVDGEETKVEVVDGEKRIDISHLILLRGDGHETGCSRTCYSYGLYGENVYSRRRIECLLK